MFEFKLWINFNEDSISSFYSKYQLLSGELDIIKLNTSIIIIEKDGKEVKLTKLK